MKSTLQNLLRHVHAAVFDKSPAPEPVFRLGHPDGAQWSVSDRVLTARAGALERTYALGTMTVAQLANALVADGFQVTELSPRFTSLLAVVLIEGEGGQNVSNGDLLQGFTSLLWVLMTGYAAETMAAREQVRQALRQMVITQAENDWLDVWGLLYGVQRGPGEADANYATRIPREAFRMRNNARAIEKAVFEATGFDVRIAEPWREIFRLDDSALSGGAKFYDGATVGYHLIRPEALDDTVDWSRVLPIIDRNKPAGVIVSEYLVRPTRRYWSELQNRGQTWSPRRSWVTARSTWVGFNEVIDTWRSTW